MRSIRFNPGTARTAACLTALAGAASAAACPVCDSATGRQVREGILDAGFGRNLAATVLPFLIFAVAGAAARFWPRGRAGREKQ